MTNPAHQTATRDTVRAYLLAAYQVNESTVDEAMRTVEAIADLEKAGPPFNSHAYYPGDKIAARHSWAENPDYDIDEEDEDDDEG